ncbi:MAG TPA: hypothetical protein VG676_08310 [Chitinophagaceae bacterium]|nr:hypothetical protein [Chitinophagaceae bacterium]
MNTGKWFFAIVFCAVSSLVSAQKIVYSEPEREDTRRMNFDIVGKIDGNFLVYKNIRNSNSIVIFNDEMQQVAKVEQDYLPDYDRMINVDFFAYSNFFYMIYQYQKRNIVYCIGVKLDGNGKRVSDVMEMDTTRIGFAANNKIYTVLSSEDKSKLIVFKINSKNKKMYYMTTMLYDNNLQLLKKSRLSIPMEDHDDFLNEFYLDNDGDLVFTKFLRSNNDNISEASFVIKPAMDDTLIVNDLKIDKTYLDEIHIKVDNFNKRYLLSSFYYRQRRGTIDGFYFYIWDKNTSSLYRQDTIIFSDDLKKEARGENSTKMAFNDYFIRNVIIKKDGGFLIASESYYTTSRYNNWNRWDYLYGTPFVSPWGYYYYSPYYSNLWWNSRYNNNSNVRFHADNIAVLSFDAAGKLQWSNVIGKSQYDDQSDDELSYQLMNTGDQLHFLFNDLERRTNLLNDYTISPEGQLNHNPTLKNLDRGYEFMPKYGKQVSARQIIIPCIHRNLICFAKVDYN